jgi:hypothetical protein
VKGELLSGQEVLDQLADVPRNSHKKFLVRCDSGKSPNCRFEYEIQFRDYLKHTKTNNGDLLCLQCSRHLKASGRLNPNTKHHLIDDNVFSVIDSPAKAYALGWIASDGHVAKRGFVIQILGSDSDVLKTLSKLLFNNDAHLSYNKRGMVVMRVDSKQIALDLAKLLQIPFGRKCDIVKYPDIPTDLDVYFVRGIFDGDGCVSHTSHRQPQCFIKSLSYDLLKSIQDRFGGYLWRDTLTWRGSKCFKFLNTLYDNEIDLRLKRKFEKYKMYESELVNRSAVQAELGIQ